MKKKDFHFSDLNFPQVGCGLLFKYQNENSMKTVME